MVVVAVLLVPVTFVVMLVAEHVRPGRDHPRPPGWLGRCLPFLVLTGAARTLGPALLAGALPARPLLAAVPGAIAGFVVADLVSYGVQRLVHNVPWLWRWVHQLHHSAERVDVAGGVFFHPFDLGAQVGATAVAVVLLELGPGAAALAGYLAFATGLFAHLDVHTPQWLGWLIQRPEAHAVHHARGVHAYNYGTIMLWELF